jgi:hypothetical protein
MNLTLVIYATSEYNCDVGINGDKKILKFYIVLHLISRYRFRTSVVHSAIIIGILVRKWLSMYMIK